MTDNYIYSTLTTDVTYALYGESPANGAPAIVKASVFIAGKANVINKNLITPMGVMTKVSDEELSLLKENHTFKRHVDSGFIKIETRKVDPEVVAPDMQISTVDEGAQVTPEYIETFKAKEGKKSKLV
jgi:hypothetical protein